MIKPGSDVDNVSAVIFEQRIRFLARHIAELLVRTSRSNTFALVRDFAVGIYNPSGQMLYQTGIPILSFAINPCLKNILKYFTASASNQTDVVRDIFPGDVILHNDVYSGGNQNNDWGIYKPVFYKDRLVAWACAKGHMADSGGGTAGGYDPTSSEIWQESLRIPPLKVFENGRLRRDVWDMVFANVRYQVVADDVNAMIGSCTMGEREILKLLERYGAGRFLQYQDYLLTASERYVRGVVSKWQDGEFHGESFMNSDGVTPNKKYRIAVDIIKRDSEINFDFSGTDAQAPSYTNMPESASLGAASVAFLMLLRPGDDNYFNEGLFTPLKAHFPLGSILNPRFPAATTMGNQIADQVIEAVMRALAKPLPERVIAGWNFMCGLKWAGTDPRTGDQYVDFGFFCEKGGGAAVEGTDGMSGIDDSKNGGSKVSIDVEMLEATSPVTVIEYEYRPDSAGAGQFRGGYGTKSRIRFDGEETSIATFGDGVESEGASPPYGLFGGKSGALNRFTLVFPDGKRYTMGSKEMVKSVPKGAIIEIMTGGGGGYGDPAKRSRTKILREIEKDLLSLNKAISDYGIRPNETKDMRPIQDLGKNDQS